LAPTKNEDILRYLAGGDAFDDIDGRTNSFNYLQKLSARDPIDGQSDESQTENVSSEESPLLKIEALTESSESIPSSSHPVSPLSKIDECTELS
jgi:hypothetical protein